MRLVLYFTLLFPLTLLSQEQLNSEKFWTELEGLCGKAFEGAITAGAVPGDGFTGERLIMHVRSCNPNEIKIPFFVGEDKSRTWVLRKNAHDIISLKHDHRHPDGTEETITQYGGTSSNHGLPNLQMFPADEHTSKLIAAASTNVWWFTIDPTSFTYNLRRIGSDRLFSVKFDLTKEIETPDALWGYE